MCVKGFIKQFEFEFESKIRVMLFNVRVKTQKQLLVGVYKNKNLSIFASLIFFLSFC